MAFQLVKLTIDGREVTVEKGTTILGAAASVGIGIPTLCYHPLLPSAGSCRICLVEIGGSQTLVPACSREVSEGLAVMTQTERVLEARKILIELLLAGHPQPCSRARIGIHVCELEALAAQHDIKGSRFVISPRNRATDDSNAAILFDPSSCILCNRCLRACNEIEVNEVIGLKEKGFGTRIVFDLNTPMGASSCVTCGECVQFCPTGALIEKSLATISPVSKLDIVSAICPYCAVGCKIQYFIEDGHIVSVSGDVAGPANRGSLCVKGRFGHEYVGHPERLTIPLIRKEGVRKGKICKRNVKEVFREATWDEALSFVSRSFLELRERYGARSLCGLSSGKCSNEENYLFQKLMRAAIGTNNVDHCARLCHSSSVYALHESIGSGAMTNSIDDIQEADVILITGSNITENHPVIASFVKRAVKKGTKLIVIDPRNIDIVRYATLHLQPKPGTDVALLNGIMKVIIDENLHDMDFISSRTEDFEKLQETLSKYTLELVQRITGVSKESIVEAARMYGSAERGSIFWGMGISQHTTGSDNSFALINLALLTGNVGRKGTGLNPLRGQNNVQGASDMGALPMYLPGYQLVNDESVREKFESAWNAKIDPEPGLTVTEMFNEALVGRIRGMYVMGENPMLSNPNISKVEESLKSLEFLVVQDIFLTETAEFADVVLPAALTLEKEGTYVNTERRVQLSPRAFSPPGSAREDWRIVCEMSTRLRYPMNYSSVEDIWKEITSLVPLYWGITKERLKGAGIQWPCISPNDPGTSVMHTESFPRHRARFIPKEFLPAKELPDEEFPYILNTGRTLEHWHTGSMTRRVAVLNALRPTGFVEVSKEDLKKEGMRDGETIRVVSRRGHIDIRAKLSKRMAPGCVFIPFHFKEAAANLLTIDELDKHAKIPEYKFCAVRLEKLSAPSKTEGASS